MFVALGVVSAWEPSLRAQDQLKWLANQLHRATEPSVLASRINRAHPVPPLGPSALSLSPNPAPAPIETIQSTSRTSSEEHISFLLYITGHDSRDHLDEGRVDTYLNSSTVIDSLKAVLTDYAVAPCATLEVVEDGDDHRESEWRYNRAALMKAAFAVHPGLVEKMRPGDQQDALNEKLQQSGMSELRDMKIQRVEVVHADLTAETETNSSSGVTINILSDNEDCDILTQATLAEIAEEPKCESMVDLLSTPESGVAIDALCGHACWDRTLRLLDGLVVNNCARNMDDMPSLCNPKFECHSAQGELCVQEFLNKNCTVDHPKGACAAFWPCFTQYKNKTMCPLLFPDLSPPEGCCASWSLNQFQEPCCFDWEDNMTETDCSSRASPSHELYSKWVEGAMCGDQEVRDAFPGQFSHSTSPSPTPSWVNPCLGLNECSGHGECKTDGKGKGYCQCDKGWGRLIPNVTNATLLPKDCRDFLQDACGARCFGNGECRQQMVPQRFSFNGTVVRRERTAPRPTCKCNPGFVGEYCNIWARCHSLSYCSGNGVCTRSHLAERCDCEPGYTGLDCGTVMDSCPAGCSGHGRCRRDMGGGRWCDCDKNYRGADCLEYIGGTCPKHCSGKGSCLPDGLCQCSAGWATLDCGLRIVQCKHSCGHGYCRGGRCECEEGWSGKECNVYEPFNSTDGCDAMNFCSGKGACVSDENGTAECVCFRGFTGMYCEQVENTPEDCPNSCSGNGRCILMSVLFCKCEPGWTGSDCSVPTCKNSYLYDPTNKDHVCSGHGVCWGSDCMCDFGYGGGDCGFMLCPGIGSVCSGHGECDVSNGTCACEEDWGSLTCNVDLRRPLPEDRDTILSGEGAGQAVQGSDLDKGNGVTPVVDCTSCAVQFKDAGGCHAMEVKGNVTSMIPRGCDQCGAAAAALCNMPAGSIAFGGQGVAGGTVTVAADGTRTTVTGDGLRVVTAPDGTSTSTSPDGQTVTVTNADGSVLSTSNVGADGTVTTMSGSGVRTTVSLSGESTTTAPDGTTTTASPDGSEVTVVTPDGTSTTSTVTNGVVKTVVTNTDGTVTTTTAALEDLVSQSIASAEAATSPDSGVEIETEVSSAAASAAAAAAASTAAGTDKTFAASAAAAAATHEAMSAAIASGATPAAAAAAGAAAAAAAAARASGASEEVVAAADADADAALATAASGSLGGTTAAEPTEGSQLYPEWAGTGAFTNPAQGDLGVSTTATDDSTKAITSSIGGSPNSYTTIADSGLTTTTAADTAATQSTVEEVEAGLADQNGADAADDDDEDADPGCPNDCNGRGSCTLGACVCVDGWSGAGCQTAPSAEYQGEVEEQ